MFHRIVTGLAFSFSFRHPRGLLSACWALTVAIRLCLPAGAFAQSSLLATATELDVMRIAGTPEGSGSADGVGRSALFRSPAGIWGDHSPRLNTTHRPIVHKYREGKVKRTPARGVK